MTYQRDPDSRRPRDYMRRDGRNPNLLTIGLAVLAVAVIVMALSSFYTVPTDRPVTRSSEAPITAPAPIPTPTTPPTPQ